MTNLLCRDTAPTLEVDMVKERQSFTGTESYIADMNLMADVNAAIILERPLLVRGEPGTGKTMLAHAVAENLGMRLITWP